MKPPVLKKLHCLKEDFAKMIQTPISISDSMTILRQEIMD